MGVQRDGTYLYTKDDDIEAVINDNFESWQLNNSRLIARAMGPFHPRLLQRPDGLLCVEYILDGGALLFAPDETQRRELPGYRCNEMCKNVFRRLALGEITEHIRKHMADIIGYMFDVQSLPARQCFIDGGRHTTDFSMKFIPDERSPDEIISAFNSAKAALSAAETYDEKINAMNILYYPVILGHR